MYTLNHLQQNQKPKPKISKPFIVVIILIILVIFGWAGLTKAGFLPNYFGIEILCPESEIYIQNNINNFDEPIIQHYSSSTSPEDILWGKPVIYLYPEKTMNIKVELDFQGEIIADYPNYNPAISGWDVIAYADGRLINKADNKEYSYLFWEGNPKNIYNFDLSHGFIVEGKDMRWFLQEKLSEIGLTPKEYNEFIVYWYPLMKNNKYNLIHFAGKEYTNVAPLTITPQPDSLLRVFMVFKSLDELIDIEPQKILPFERNGFTVVEWGGTELK